jgi:4-amino-4-deoxy-L-arabinose transferase-like glycosyltransferase
LSPCLLVCVVALALRLLAWRWHELYELGGDEQEYFNQALKLLRDHVYVELNLMRPPLYTGFLAACMYLFDSLVQRLRLVQAIISALTVVPIYLLARRLFDRRVGFIAALLAALSYTLAIHATELLTETLFVFGLATLFWLLLSAAEMGTARQGDRARGRRKAMLFAALAGLNLGALALLRSVALPLLPLGAFWLLLRTKNQEPRTKAVIAGRAVACSLSFVLGALLVIAPWTARNYASYGALILIDTTGAENLWLDNNPTGSTPADPRGREAAKKQLYALGDDRAARQRLASAKGTAAILTHPVWFLQKAWGETQQFFALEYFDDMRDRRAIWLPPLDVWLRLALGDGIWLLLLFGGAIGLWLAPPLTPDPIVQRPASSVHPKWLFVPWLGYILLTSMLFHVELRYRLPVYPALLPYAAWTLVRIVGDRRPRRVSPKYLSSCHLVILSSAALTCLIIAGITLLHRPYISESWLLARKHVQLWQAQRALDGGDAAGAQAAAEAALVLDPESALAQVALARAALAQGDSIGALNSLDQAIVALDAHPYAHLLRGAILRDQGDLAGAKAELVGYEQASLEDLQDWSWQAFAPSQALPSAIDIGDGLDLGYVRGFWPAVAGGGRWSRPNAEIMLFAPAGSDMRLELKLDNGRPAGAAAPQVRIFVGGHEVGQVVAEAGWHSYSLAVPAELIPETRRLVVAVRSPTFRPRDFDRASPDNRALGVLVGRAEITKR